jgi:hypothetical protein
MLRSRTGGPSARPGGHAGKQQPGQLELYLGLLVRAGVLDVYLGAWILTWRCRLYACACLAVNQHEESPLQTCFFGGAKEMHVWSAGTRQEACMAGQAMSSCVRSGDM